MPDIVGLDYRTAASRLEASGLKVDQQTESSDSVPVGSVTGTDPAVNTLVAKGSTVKVFTSAGPSKVQVPDVARQDAKAAAILLEARGLKVDRQTESSDSVPAGSVTRTDPPANSPVAKGWTVKLFVSSGPELVAVPNVAGLDAKAAAKILMDVGLNFKELNESSDSVLACRVIRTNPAANLRVARGATVTLYVSSGPRGTIGPPCVSR